MGAVDKAEKFKSQTSTGNQWTDVTGGGASGTADAKLYSH